MLQSLPCFPLLCCLVPVHPWKEKDDIQALNEELEQDNVEQDNEHSTTTQELVVDDAVIIGDNGKDNEEHDIQVANEEQQSKTT